MNLSVAVGMPVTGLQKSGFSVRKTLPFPRSERRQSVRGQLPIGIPAIGLGVLAARVSLTTRLRLDDRHIRLGNSD